MLYAQCEAQKSEIRYKSFFFPVQIQTVKTFGHNRCIHIIWQNERILSDSNNNDDNQFSLCTHQVLIQVCIFLFRPVSAAQITLPFLSRFNCFGDFSTLCFQFPFTYSFFSSDFLSHTHTRTYTCSCHSLLTVWLIVFLFISVSLFYHTLFHLLVWCAHQRWK